MKRLFLATLAAFALFTAPAHAELPATIQWGADAEGGAPYVFPDPENTDRIIGFEVELADALSRELGRPFVRVQNAWENLIPGLLRDDIDLVINGLEVTPERQAHIAFSLPYYRYHEQVVVRKDETRIKGFDDLGGKLVGTLGGTVAEHMLNRRGDVQTRLYSDLYALYQDLSLKRLDAVFMDGPINSYYGGRQPDLMPVGEPVGEGVYAIGLRKSDGELKAALDGALKTLMANGELERILRKWQLFNESQTALIADPQLPEATHAQATGSRWQYLPALLEGAVVTLKISGLSMILAVTLGLTLATMRMFGPLPLQWLAASYVEVFRGTPLLIQLYLIYYGLPTLGVMLSPLTAAVIGLGMNYAAYEAENYRTGIRAIPKGQLEAAYALGMTRIQALIHVVLPQAVRVSLPSVTNDFIALFKDSSLVSVITMVELTKVYGLLASTTYDYIGLGLLTAALYFAISYPTARFAGWLERRLDAHQRPETRKQVKAPKTA